MHSFKDKDDREWKVDITIGDVNRVLEMLDGVDLLELGDGNTPLVLRLHGSPRLLCNVLYCLCKPQADALNITDVQFGLLMGGGSLKRGKECLFAALKSFFNDLGREEIVSVINQAGVLMETVIEELETQMSAVNMKNAAKSVSESVFTDMPESSESIPTLSASAN